MLCMSKQNVLKWFCDLLSAFRDFIYMYTFHNAKNIIYF